MSTLLVLLIILAVASASTPPSVSSSSTTASSSSSVSFDRDLMTEMESNPLSKNPFFARSMAERFQGPASEGLRPGM